MARTDDDTWDLASSVGSTATWVAAARALASKQANPLIDDAYADVLVKAVGLKFCNRMAWDVGFRRRGRRQASDMRADRRAHTVFR